MDPPKQFPQPQQSDNETMDAQPARRVVAAAHRRSSSRLIHRRRWFLLGILVLGVMTLVALAHESIGGPGQTRVRQFGPIPVRTAAGTFRQYPLPRSDRQAAGAASDPQGRGRV